MTDEIDLTPEAVERDARYWSDWADDVERGNGAGADVANMRRMMTTLRALSARLAEVEADNEGRNREMLSMERLSLERLSRAEAAEAKLAQAVEALRFYGGVMPVSFCPGQDGGAKARATLAQIGGDA